MVNVWTDLSPGKKAPQEINVVIEIPKGSHNKYEIDKETGLLHLDRVMHSRMSYPGEYGFIPQTLWEDGDALDVLVISTETIPSLCTVIARPVGVMHMTDNGDSDAKIIAVPVKDPRFDHVHELKDLNPHLLKEIEHFFETYKQLEKKVVKVQGFNNRLDAIKAIQHGIDLYKKKIGSK